MEITNMSGVDYLTVVQAPTLAAASGRANSVALTALLVPNEVPATKSATPAAIVTLSPVAEPSPVYPEPTVVVSYLRDNTYTGPGAMATSKALMQSLNHVSEKKTTFPVSSLFSQVGALSRETNEYRNEVRQFRVPQRLATDKFSPEFSGVAGKLAESAVLTIKTKEGDSIQIEFSRKTSADGSSHMEFSFVVDGELSEMEQRALAKLTGKLGALGDEFFRNDTTELRGLTDVDTDVISYFKLTLQRPDSNEDKPYVEHSYEFSIDEVAQTQSLIATDVLGYSVDIKSQLYTLAKDKVLEIELFQQYIELIHNAADDSETPNASKRFMLDAFESMFAGFFATAKTDLKNEEERAESVLAAYDTGMPDFKASFRSPVFKHPEMETQVDAMVLTLAQQTRIEQNGDNLLVKQETNYEYSRSYFEDFPKEYLDDLGGTYSYTTESEKGSFSRFLSMTNEHVNNIWIEQEASKEKQTSHFVNYKMIDQDNSSSEDRRLQEFGELLKKLNDNNQYTGVKELLHSSKEKFFLDI